MDAPRRRLDPLALAVNGVAIALMVGVGAYLAFSYWRDRPAPPPKPVRFEVVDQRPLKEKRDFDPGGKYGFVVAGDAQFRPDRLSILRERLDAQAGARLEGKRVEVVQLLTWYVTTPQARLVEAAPGMPAMPAEEVWRIPELRKHRYWVICDVAVTAEGRRAQGRGIQGFDSGPADFAAHHRRALLQAIDGVVRGL